MHIHEAFIHAMQHTLICILKDRQGHSRVVQPYGIFLTQQQKIMYCCYQLAGYSESHRIPNWRNFPVSEIEEVATTERTFTKRKDFNPDNKMVYPKWVEKI